jgi:hypothetical protein
MVGVRVVPCLLACLEGERERTTHNTGEKFNNSACCEGVSKIGYGVLK